ncbi:MAG: hypothetical protein ACYTG2_19240 [Planctomycetota bacterium]|jgi:hypothetical protein
MSRPRAARRAARNTARFWVLHRDSWVRLALAWGESAELHSGGEHEEGYSWRAEVYTNTGDRVTCDTTEAWRDCDGPGDRFCASFCMLDELQARDTEDQLLAAPGGLPVWRVEEQRMRDHFAEAMGY